MSLQRGENVRGWSGVTKNMAVNGEERAAWRFMMFSMMVALIVTGTVAYILSQTDIPVVAKALLGLLFLLFTLMLISGIYSVKMRRASSGKAASILQGKTTGTKASSSPASAGSTTTTAAEEAAQAAARAAQEERARVAAAEAEAVAKATADAQAAEAAAAARAAEEAAEQERQRQVAAAKAAEEARQRAEAEAAAAEKTSEDLGPDRDGDGVAEGKDEGVRPAGLDAARNGQPDDLKLIKGIGPKLEGVCNSLGFWHFDQIAAWTPDEVAWVDSNLEGFNGRVTRDDWIAQAKILAAGGTTEFAERQKDD